MHSVDFDRSGWLFNDKAVHLDDSIPSGYSTLLSSESSFFLLFDIQVACFPQGVSYQDAFLPECVYVETGEGCNWSREELCGEGLQEWAAS